MLGLFVRQRKSLKINKKEEVKMKKIVGFILLLMAGYQLSAAPTAVVTNTNDSGPGSLRDAIANVDSGGNVIVLLDQVENNTIQLKSQLLINKNVNIDGQDQDGSGEIMTLEGGPEYFHILTIGSNVTVNISNIDFINGAYCTFAGDIGGGAILNQGNLALTNCTVSNNTVYCYEGNGGGGGIANVNGSLSLYNCNIFSNSAQIEDGSWLIWGGGIYSSGGTVTLNGTTIESNQLVINEGDITSFGGGIYIKNGTLIITGDVVIEKNNASFDTESNSVGFGGGICADNASIMITPPMSTYIIFNTAGEQGSCGGGIHLMNNSIITGAAYLVCSSNTPDNIN